MYNKGLIYKSIKIVPYSTGLNTVITNNLDKKFRDCTFPSTTAITVTFPIIGDSDFTSLIAESVTPWTLPSNLALVVFPDLDYCKW